ncbi:MAG: hypothetical protein ABEI99_06450, partial [Halobaculum sp.]
RSMLRKGVGVATMVIGSTAAAGNASAASDADYLIDIEGAENGDYTVKVPYGNDGNFGITFTQGSDDDGSQNIVLDDDDREAFLTGQPGPDGFDEWETSSTGEPTVERAVDCTVDILKFT